VTNLRGKILTISPTGEGGRCRDYICTAHYCDHIEIVPTRPGTEGMVFPPIPLSGPGLVGVVYDSREDAALIRRVKDRCESVIRGLEEGRAMFSFLFPPSALSGTRRGVERNLARLESLDGDQPTAVSRPTPSKDTRSALDRVFDELFAGDLAVVGDIQDSMLPKEMVGANPSYVGKLAFIEIPLECDEGDGESGEYIVVQQTPDSLYGIRTTCCKAGLEVVRLPLALDDKQISIVDSYDDDEFVQEFIERLDDMDTDDYEPIECDLAETASRQLKRMLEKKLSNRAKAMDAPKLNTLGCTTSRMNSHPRVCCGV